MKPTTEAFKIAREIGEQIGDDRSFAAYLQACEILTEYIEAESDLWELNASLAARRTGQRVQVAEKTKEILGFIDSREVNPYGDAV